MRSLKDAKVKNKRVLVRCDFNVPLDDKGQITDDFRIRSTLPTINWLIKNGAKVILMSHFGSPEGNIVETLKMDVVQQRLTEYLDLSVVKAPDCVGKEIESWTKEMKPGEILLLENLRFHKEEEENDSRFAKKLAALGDIYINDAFGTCHRAHASIVGAPKFLPPFAGLLLEKEIKSLNKIIKNPKRPLVAAMGGAKVSTKIKLMKELLNYVDHLFVGGVLANTILKAKGMAVGKSKVDDEMIEETKKLNLTSQKFHLPIDVVVSRDVSGEAEIMRRGPGSVGEDELILDIGPDTIRLFESIAKKAKVIFWNGPMGYYENEKFAKGTIALAEIIARSKAYSIIGGGDAVSILEKLNLTKNIDHISTGGGAMLAYIAGEELPGIKALKQ